MILIAQYGCNAHFSLEFPVDPFKLRKRLFKLFLLLHLIAAFPVNVLERDYEVSVIVRGPDDLALEVPDFSIAQHTVAEGVLEIVPEGHVHKLNIHHGFKEVPVIGVDVMTDISADVACVITGGELLAVPVDHYLIHPV